METNLPKKLYRSRKDKIIAGVCGGLGEYFSMDPLIFRIIFLVLLFAGGTGFWLYIVLAIIIPKEPLLGHQPNAANPGDQFKQNVNEFVADVKASAQHWASEARGWDEQHQQVQNRRRMWFGVIIVAIGVIALMNQLFPQYWVRWSILWPVVIIIVGIAILSRGQHR